MSDDLGALAAVDLRREESPIVPLPGTGEAIDLRDPVDVARGITRARQLQTELKDAIHFLTDVLRIEAMNQGKKTLRLGGYQVEIRGGTRIEWDPERLMDELRAAGMSEERISEVVKEEVRYSVSATNAAQAARANPDYAAAVERCRTHVPAAWFAKVTK